MDKALFKTVIVEDEPKDMDLFKKLLMPFSQLEVVCLATNIETAIAAISYHRPDVIFLDIILHGQDSFRVLDIIRQFDLNPVVIFTTAHDGYMKDAFNYSAFQYSLKPIDRMELKQCIERLSLNNQPNFTGSYTKFQTALSKLVFPTVYGFVVVEPNDIVYIQASEGYSGIYSKTGECITVTRRLGEIEEMLNMQLFFRMHRSYIINLDYVKEVTRVKGDAVLVFKTLVTSIKISRESAKLLKDALTNR